MCAVIQGQHPQPVEHHFLALQHIAPPGKACGLGQQEMELVIHDMIRTKKWQQARTLMAQRPDLELDPKDQYLLDMQTASAGFFSAKNEAGSASYKAQLINLMGKLYETPELHDEDTLSSAAEFSADLEQPVLAARYYRLLADNFPQDRSDHFEECARVLKRFHIYTESADCYESAIASTNDPVRKTQLQVRLGRLHQGHGESPAAISTLESLVATVPDDKGALDYAASFALEIGRPDLAYPLYASLAQVEPERAIFWYEKAAKWSEASNLPGLSAEYILSIRDLSDEQYHEELTQRRQKLLVAAGRNEEALNTIFERITANPDSGDVLIEGITLAQSMGLTQQASEWNEELLSIRPYDIDAMTRQVSFSMATQRLADALSWSKKLLEQEPYERAHHVRIAQLEEWTGNVDNAMKKRKWLAENYPSIDNDKELLRLAELNWDSTTAANTLRRIARTTPLSTEDLFKLVKLYEQDGTPHLAASALEEMLGGKDDAMILRELATLHVRHINFEAALATWEKFANRFGRSAEESLHRMELLWRLKRPEEAVAVADPIDQFNSNSASQYQLSLLTELGWRYRRPELVFAAAPYLDRIDNEDFSYINNRRLVQSLIDENNYEQAVVTSENLWRRTDEISYLLTAIDIALREDIYPHKERFLDANGDLLKVREIPDYWLSVADYYNRTSDMPAAIETYRNTLAAHPDNKDAMSGLIWSLLGSDTDDETLITELDKYEALATKTPKLWNPYAVGYLRAGDPKSSLRWFSKLMARGDNDYNILLSFADALEQSGNTNHSFKVRQYAMGQLLPRAMAEADGKIDQLGRDYISLLRSFGSAAENEAWTQKLVSGIDHSSPEEGAWRRELAASWYLATQRNEYARLVMTKMHERRMESPVWQRLAVALTDNNLPEVKEILASSKGTLSSGDEILALRKLGHEQQAFTIAKNIVENSNSATESNIAREHLMSMRGSRPGYYAGRISQRELGDLDITESGLSLRHTLSATDIGFEIDYKRNQISSSQVALTNDSEENIEISAHFGNNTRGGRLTAGVSSYGTDDLNYTGGAYHIRDLEGKREFTSEMTFNEVPDSTTASQRLNAKQDRAELALRSNFGKREFIKLSGNVSELSTRDTDERILRGFGASVELGTTGSIGSNNWTMGVIATGTRNEQNLFRSEQSQLALSASLFRGGIKADYPSAASPRYQLSARVGHNWNSEQLDLQLQAGAGFRLLGNDELSFQVEHQSGVEALLINESNSTVGVQYTNHF